VVKTFAYANAPFAYANPTWGDVSPLLPMRSIVFFFEAWISRGTLVCRLRGGPSKAASISYSQIGDSRADVVGYVPSARSPPAHSTRAQETLPQEVLDNLATGLGFRGDRTKAHEKLCAVL
jgi:hypothetical protein